MNSCSVCDLSFSRRDAMIRHRRNKHGNGNSTETTLSSEDSQDLHRDPMDAKKMTFKHPFTMVVSGPTGSGKTEWTRKVFLSNLIEPVPERIVFCFGQWQTMYKELEKRFPFIEFVHGIPDYINQPRYLDITKRNLIVLDDLMTEAKCDQRIADLFTRGSHHRNLSVMYLTQNLFPQGKACRDIALNTQYLVLFNNPIDRQQVATLARRIYPANSNLLMKTFERATSKPYGYLVIDLKANTPEQDRLRTDIFPKNETKRMHLLPSDIKSERVSDSESIDSDEGDTNNGKKMSHFDGPPGKRFREDLREQQSRKSIWDRRFKEPLRKSNQERFEASVNEYLERGYSQDEAVTRAVNDSLPQLRKNLRRDYGHFLIDFYGLQQDTAQQQILQSADKLRREHDMTFPESIRQAVKLRKDLFTQIWPDHVIGEGGDESEEENA